MADTDLIIIDKGAPDWQVGINKNFTALNNKALAVTDTGWIQDGLSVGKNVANINNLAYRIIQIGGFRRMHLRMDVDIKKAMMTATWGTLDTQLFSIPSNYSFNDPYSVQRFIVFNGKISRPIFTFRTFPHGNVTLPDGLYFDAFAIKGDGADNYGDMTEISLNCDIDLA